MKKGINYICKTHRENEANRKNKLKLCYARIEKKKIFINNSEEIKYYFKINLVIIVMRNILEKEMLI